MKNEFPRPVFPMSDSKIEHFRKFFENNELRKMLSEKKYSIKTNADASYRIINHWESIGLIDNTRESEGDWRKFSMRDLVWQRIIMTLRNFGFPNEKIANVKKCLFISKDDKDDYYPLLDYYIAATFAREKVFLVVEADGNANIEEYKRIRLNEDAGIFSEHHLKIDLNKIVKSIFPNAKPPKVDIAVPLNDEELAIVEALNSKKYISIKIKGLDGKTKLLEKTEKIDAEKRIIEIIKENKFQNIELKQKNGKIVSLTRTTKEKL